MMNIHETLVKLRVMLHEAEVDASLGNEEAAQDMLLEIAELVRPGEPDKDVERLVPECSTCTYYFLDSHCYPCNVCETEDGKWSRWESFVGSSKEDDPEETKVTSEQKTCANCTHSIDILDQSLNSKECSSCEDLSNWELEDLEETKVTPEQKTCSTCKFEDYDATRIPCDVCHQIVGGDSEKWEPKQNLNEVVADLAEGAAINCLLAKAEKACETCLHGPGPIDITVEPCMDCGGSMSGWRPKS